MKIARVIPLFNNGDNKELTNYRPVSLLPRFSNFLEIIFHKRLMNFLDDKKVLYDSQYGFRKIDQHHWLYYSLWKKSQLPWMIVSLQLVFLLT